MSGVVLGQTASLVLAGGELLLRVGSHRARPSRVVSESRAIERCLNSGERYEGKITDVAGATVTATLALKEQ
jgi:hypothetical protein